MRTCRLLCQCVLPALVVIFMSVSSQSSVAQSTNKRVPAEWEPQAAIWLQWPGRYEQVFEPAFAAMSEVITRYQLLHILCDNQHICERAKTAVASANMGPDNANLAWHMIPNDSAWMRDNGPVYVVEDNALRIQDWSFNAWGGAFGKEILYRKDNRVPSQVAEYLKLPVDRIDIVHERGNLEFNGSNAVILNWSTLGDPDRNPGYDREQARQDMAKYFGVSKVIFIEGILEGDLTRGHIDGIARFINPTTVVVPQCTESSLCRPGEAGDSGIFNRAAQTIAAAGFNVIRDPVEAFVEYQGKKFDTNYMNWIVGNGFVIAVGFGDEEADQAAKARIEGYFPGREVHVIEMLASWHAGGAAHCHTNDQPALSTAWSTMGQ